MTLAAPHLTGVLRHHRRAPHRLPPILPCLGLSLLLSCHGITRAEEHLPSPSKPEVKLKQAFELDVVAHTGRWASAPLNDIRNFSGDPEKQGATGHVTARTDLRIGRQFSAHLAATGSYGTGRPASGWNATLREGWASVSDAEQLQRITLGKQTINWSQDTTFHLLDLTGPSNARRNHTGLHEYDLHQQEGTLAIRQMGSTENLRWDLVLADASHNQVRPGRWQWATRFSTNLAGGDASLVLERTRGHSTRTGISFSRYLNDYWDIYTEVLHAGERDIPDPEDAIPAVPVSPSLTLPAVSRFADKPLKQETSQWLIALRRNIQDTGLAEISYFFNGNGMGDDAWQDYTNRLRTAESTYHRPEFQPFYPNAATNPHSVFLAEAANHGEWQLMRRHYINLRLDTLEYFSFGRLEANLLTSLEDRGMTAMVTFRRALTNRAQLSTFMINTFAPRGSEASTVPTRFTIGFGLNAAF